MTTSAAPPPLELVPPPDPAAVYRLGLIGLAAAGLAAVLGAIADLALGGGPAILGTARLLLIAAGAVIAGVAVAQRPGLWKAWAILAGVTILAAVVAVPPHWDSGRLLARLLSFVTVAGTVLVALPVVPRLSLLSAAVLFHFGGILTATTWPEPAPWLTVQSANRVYMPYLTAIYMRNAYHFYSPEPGPASLLHILVKYELDQTDPATGKKKIVREWLVLPDRMAHMKDPLGLSYYRRLSITEAVSRAIADAYAPESFNKHDAWRNRTRSTRSGSTGRPTTGRRNWWSSRSPRTRWNRPGRSTASRTRRCPGTCCRPTPSTWRSSCPPPAGGWWGCRSTGWNTGSSSRRRSSGRRRSTSRWTPTTRSPTARSTWASTPRTGRW